MVLFINISDININKQPRIIVIFLVFQNWVLKKSMVHRRLHHQQNLPF